MKKIILSAVILATMAAACGGGEGEKKPKETVLPLNLLQLPEPIIQLILITKKDWRW